jgi:2-polyprenyl-6-hydroxyphenyl methylase/3-demethylubiquinone-9 3-methyltransferase
MSTVSSLKESHAAEVAKGERFKFGENWTRFLSTLNDRRIELAVQSLQRMLEVEDLRGRSFLDIGSGSGLFSLAARKLGARVFSFDFDPASVACTTELRRRYFAGDPEWTIEHGSALDPEYVKSLGKFDIVYSWGVLHHTGQMWLGLENAAFPVRDGGKLFIAIYGDTGTEAQRWVYKKRLYNKLPSFLQPAYALLLTIPGEIKTFARYLLTGKPFAYIETWTNYAEVGASDSVRGMSRWHDIVDWVGGYPYEYAKVEEILDFYRKRGFNLIRLVSGGLGCNEFVFSRDR